MDQNHIQNLTTTDESSKALLFHKCKQISQPQTLNPIQTQKSPPSTFITVIGQSPAKNLLQFTNYNLQLRATHTLPQGPSSNISTIDHQESSSINANLNEVNNLEKEQSPNSSYLKHRRKPAQLSFVNEHEQVQEREREVMHLKSSPNHCSQNELFNVAQSNSKSESHPKNKKESYLNTNNGTRVPSKKALKNSNSKKYRQAVLPHTPPEKPPFQINKINFIHNLAQRKGRIDDNLYSPLGESQMKECDSVVETGIRGCSKPLSQRSNLKLIQNQEQQKLLSEWLCDSSAQSRKRIICDWEDIQLLNCNSNSNSISSTLDAKKSHHASSTDIKLNKLINLNNFQNIRNNPKKKNSLAASVENSQNFDGLFIKSVLTQRSPRPPPKKFYVPNTESPNNISLHLVQPPPLNPINYQNKKEFLEVPSTIVEDERSGIEKESSYSGGDLEENEIMPFRLPHKYDINPKMSSERLDTVVTSHSSEKNQIQVQNHKLTQNMSQNQKNRFEESLIKVKASVKLKGGKLKSSSPPILAGKIMKYKLRKNLKKLRGARLTSEENRVLPQNVLLTRNHNLLVNNDLKVLSEKEANLIKLEKRRKSNNGRLYKYHKVIGDPNQNNQKDSMFGKISLKSHKKEASLKSERKKKVEELDKTNNDIDILQDSLPKLKNINFSRNKRRELLYSDKQAATTISCLNPQNFKFKPLNEKLCENITRSQGHRSKTRSRNIMYLADLNTSQENPTVDSSVILSPKSESKNNSSYSYVKRTLSPKFHDLVKEDKCISTDDKAPMQVLSARTVASNLKLLASLTSNRQKSQDLKKKNVFSRKANGLLQTVQIKEGDIQVKLLHISENVIKYLTSCKICLKKFELGEECGVLECKHMFHIKCIQGLELNEKNLCPLCKRKTEK